jgi:hypothetical protein
MKLTIKKVNKAIQEIESGWELAKGKGYFYWVHDTDMSYLDLQTVDAYRLNFLTLDEWIEEFKTRRPAYGTLAYYDWQLEQEVA